MDVHRLSAHYKDIYIVNSNYNHYGNSVLSTIHSNSILANPSKNNSRSNTNHSVGSTSSKRALNDEAAKKKPKFNYRSLLSPENLSVKKLLNRLDNDSFSVFSYSSRNIPLSINSLPVELMKLILSYTDSYETAIYCLYVNKHFYKAAKAVVYEAPFLTSTYRLAQLVSSLRENPANGELVKSLDLSKLSPGLLIDDDNASITTHDEAVYLDYALASWRDWKYKGDPLYGSSLLNSYNLSKSKSTVSVDSLSTVTSFKFKLFKRFKDENSIGDFHLLKFKKLSKLFKLKRNSSTTASQLKARITPNKQSKLISSSNGMGGAKLNEKNVKFNIRDPKSQPFSEPHPYTNKFLLKYSSSKDVPIGHLLYLIDLCPNLTHLDLTAISLSLDFKIVYADQSSEIKFQSLVEEVLPNDPSPNFKNGLKPFIKSANHKNYSLRPNYMSDSNVYFNMRNFQDQFVKLTESDVLLKLTSLRNLKELHLSSISWINYRNLREMIKSSQFIEYDNLKVLDLTDSGMMRNLNWARRFEDTEYVKSYFQGEREPIVDEEEDEAAVFARTVGMNY